MMLFCLFGDADQRFDAFKFFLGFQVVIATSLELFFLLEAQMFPFFVLSLEEVVVLFKGLVAVLDK